MKVAINGCWGGFSLSKEATELMADRGSAEAAQYLADTNPEIWYDFHPYGDPDDNHTDKVRADPLMIAVIEELGVEAASGSMASIRIVEVPDGVDWYIDNYDGMENVHEAHRSYS